MKQFNPSNYFPSLNLKAGDSSVDTESMKDQIINIPPEILDKQLSKPAPWYGWMKTMFGGSYNPERLNWKVFDDMANDPTIKSCITLINYALLNQGWVLTPADSSDEATEIADFVRDCFQNMTIGMRQVRKDMYTALRYGYSVSEVVYNYDLEKEKIIINRIKALHISTLYNCFEYDEYTGFVKTVWQWPFYDNPTPIPAEKCMINTFDETFGNRYGKSLLSAVYDPFFIKTQILKWWAIFIEKHEGPTLYGIAGDAGDVGAIQDSLDSVQKGVTSFVLNNGDQVGTLETQHRGEAFVNAINYYDHQIQINFMIGTVLLGRADAKGGSLAQSKTQEDVLHTFLDGVHEDMAMPFQDQVKKLVDLNFVTDKYPRFSFVPFDQNDLLTLLTALEPYAQNMLLDTNSGWWQQFISSVMKEYADIEIDSGEQSKISTGEVGSGESATVANTPELMRESVDNQDNLPPEPTNTNQRIADTIAQIKNIAGKPEYARP
jgi:hypothetical protein